MGAGFAQAGSEEEGTDLKLREYWRVVRKRLWLVAAVFAVAMLATAIHLATQTPLYTATTTINIEPSTPYGTDPVGALLAIEVASAGPDYLKTQRELLRNPTLAAHVIRSLNLADDKNFVGAEQSPGLFVTLWDRLRGVGAWLLAPHTAPRHKARAAEENPYGVAPWLIGAYLGYLDIHVVQDTTLVDISFTTPDPELSARLADAHARAYIRSGIESHSTASKEAEHFLQGKLGDLKHRLQQSELALNDYRRQKGIVPGLMALNGKDTMVLDRLSELSKDMTTAQVKRIEFEAQVELIHERHYSALPAVVSNQLIQRLETQINDLTAKSAAMEAQFTSAYPPLARLKVQMAELRNTLGQEVAKAIGATEAAYQQALAQERKLTEEVDRQKAVALSLNDAAVEYTILQREVDTNRRLYDSVLERMKNLSFAAASESSNVSIVSPALAPTVASSPKKAHTFALAAPLSLGGALGLAFLLEMLDNRLENTDKVERRLHLPTLGSIPDFAEAEGRPYTRRYGLSALRRMRQKDASPNETMSLPAPASRLVALHQPYSLASEAYRSFRTALMLARADAPPRVILMTSSVPREGKSVSAVNTAIVLAQLGGNVLLMDCDLRRPACHTYLGLGNDGGLTGILSGTQEAEQVIQPTAIEHLHLLSAGMNAPNPNELLASQTMGRLLDRMRERYSYVVIDSPPTMAVSDAVVLSTMVDGMILVVDSTSTSVHYPKAACAQLKHARARILGVLLNKVAMHSHNYGYYESYYRYYHHAADETPQEESRSADA